MKPLPVQTATALLHFHSEHRYEPHGSFTGRNADRDGRNESEPESRKTQWEKGCMSRGGISPVVTQYGGKTEAGLPNS